MHNSIYHDRLAEHFCTLSISGAPRENPSQKVDVKKKQKHVSRTVLLQILRGVPEFGL